jgi:hypothetical protein
MSYNPVPSLDNGNATFNNNVNVSGVSTFNAGVKTKLNSEVDGVTITFDMNESNTHSVRLGGSRTLAVSNVDAGQKFTLRLEQDSTGNREVTWWNNIDWIISGSGQPILNSGVGAVDYFGFLCTSGGYYDGFHMTELVAGGGGGGGGGGSYDDTAISGYFEGLVSGQTLQSITDNGATTNNDITLNSNLTAEYILAELDGPIVFECKNSTGAQIDAGTPVYISGYFSGNGKPLIAPARSDDVTRMPAIGVLESDLADDVEGYVNSFGRVQRIDTSSFTVGNTVYVAPSGGLTNVRPTGIGELVQNMGKVLRSDASQGRILLLGPGRSNDVPNSGQFAELTVNGHFSAVTKSFLIDHPSKEGMKLQYASLEGPENGVYVRGTTKETFITLPNYWRDLVHNSSITVNLTPLGQFQPLFVESKSNREIIVGGVCGYYDYVVYGERKDVAKLEVEW